MEKIPLQWHHNECNGISNLKSPASQWFAQPFDQAQLRRKYQSSVSLTFVRGIHRRLVNSPHKGPVTQKMFPFDDVIMHFEICIMESLDCSPTSLHVCTWWKNWDKMAAISQTIFSGAFSRMKRFVFWLRFQWSLFLRVQLTITQNWFR